MLDVDDETRSSVDGPVECCVCYVQRFKWDVHVAGCRCRALCQSRACFLARGAKLSRCPCVRCLSTCVDSAPGVCAGRCDGAMHMVYLKQNVSFSGFSLIVLPLPCCFELSVTVGLLAGCEGLKGGIQAPLRGLEGVATPEVLVQQRRPH